MSTLQTDPSALNEYFNKTAERLVGQNATTDDVLSHIDSLTSKPWQFQTTKSNIQWCTQVSQITTKWLFNWTRQHPSFFYQTNSRIHRLPFNIHNQQFNWRIEIPGSMENCSYRSNTEIYQPNRAEGLSSDIDSSDSIWIVLKAGFTSSNRLQ